MTHQRSKPVILNSDQEHGGIRAVVLFAVVFVGWISFSLVRVLLGPVATSSGLATLISCASAIPLTLALVWVMENWLKRVWPSGRKVMLDGTGLKVTDRSHGTTSFTWSESLKRLKWYFELNSYPRGGRERRLPKDWLCLACQFQQDEERVVIYSYFPRRKAAALLENGSGEADFEKLLPGEVYDTSFRSKLGPPTRPELSTAILAGNHGRYWLAEKRRWSEGYELTPADFKTLLEAVQSH